MPRQNCEVCGRRGNKPKCRYHSDSRRAQSEKRRGLACEYARVYYIMNRDKILAQAKIRYALRGTKKCDTPADQKLSEL